MTQSQSETRINRLQHSYGYIVWITPTPADPFLALAVPLFDPASPDCTTVVPLDSISNSHQVVLHRDNFSNKKGYALENPSTPTFSDVAPDYWAYQYIETAATHKVIGGYADGTFRPENNATRAQFSKMLMQAYAVPSR